MTDRAELILDMVATWPSLPLRDKRRLPNVPAAYCVLSGLNEPLYVGRARSLRRRWRQHHRFSQLIKFHGARLVWHQYAAEYDSPQNASTERWLQDAEAHYMRVLDPPLNNAALRDKSGDEHGELCDEINQWLTDSETE